MANTQTKALLVLLASAIVVTACSSGPATRTVYTIDDAPDTVIKSVLVVGVAGTLNTRADFERALANELRQQGIEAVAYHTVVKGSDLSRDTIEKAVGDQKVDGVIVTRETARQGSFTVREDESSLTKTAKGGSLLNLPIRLPNGDFVPLESVANWRSDQGFETLRHFNGKLSIDVSADVDAALNSTEDIVTTLSQATLPELAGRYGVEYSIEGMSANVSR